VNASSSSVTNPADGRPPALDLVAEDLLPPLPKAFLAGRDLDLLAPLTFLAPGSLALPPAPVVERRALATALGVANEAYGHPSAARLAAKLADPKTRVVVTGQQPGLFGGPLLTLTKMAAAVRWAEELEKAGEPALAVFWVATEDHDWDESTAAAFPGPAGLVRASLGPDPDPLLPLGMRTLGPGIAEAFAAWAEATPGEAADAWRDAVARAHRPEARFGEAFSRLAVAIFGARAPLLLDALLPAVKAAERPFLRRLVEDRATLEAEQAEADARVAARGFSHQVTPQRGASPLFLLRGGARRRIAWSADGESYTLRGGDGELRPVAELLDTIDDNPSVVSPGVLARPAIQDAILGTSLFVLGPGEMSYLPQAVAAYRVLGLAAPAVALRPQIAILDPRELRWLAELSLPLGALFGPGDDLARHLASAEDLARLAATRDVVLAALEEMAAPALALDASLDRPFEKTRENVLRSLDTFAEKVTAAAARRDEVRTRRAERLRAAGRPEGQLQERIVTAAHFPGRYGPRFADALLEQLALDGRLLQVIVP
jgi:bacillithiol biosynthesis cysteine-adding enzyme BshC